MKIYDTNSAFNEAVRIGFLSRTAKRVFQDPDAIYLVGNQRECPKWASATGLTARKIAYTNSRHHGKQVRSIWIIREATDDELLDSVRYTLDYLERGYWYGRNASPSDPATLLRMLARRGLVADADAFRVALVQAQLRRAAA